MATDRSEPRDIESILLEKAENEREPELNFDRFMQGVVETQTKKDRLILESEESPQRKRNRLYGERVSNRIRFTK